MYPLPQHIDATQMSCFRSCPQKFFLEFVNGFRPPGKSIHLHAGSCFALALETAYREIHLHRRPLSEALRLASAAFEVAWGSFEVPAYKKTAKTRERMWLAVEDYFNVYPPLTDFVQPFIADDGSPTFEYTFAIPLDHTVDGRPFPMHPNGDPFIYSGRFDMLGRVVSDGRIVARDEKTATSIGSAWSDQWDLRSQFLGYCWALQQAGLDCDTILVRGIAIQIKEFKHAEALKTYPRFLIQRWEEQLRRDLWRLRHCYDEGMWDFNLGESCTAYGNCIFAMQCASGNPRPEAWETNYVRSFWNPLTKNPIATQEES